MIRKAALYLRGAYGPGNLGDDVLMLAMIKILKSYYKPKEISVSVKNVKAAAKLDPEINWVPLNAPVFADITVLGGGGQFFSFRAGSADPQKRKSLWHNLNEKFSAGYSVIDLITGAYLRIVTGKGYYTRKLATFCIGVGPFENGEDPFYRQAKSILTAADFISVRDKKSKELVKSISNKDALLHADLTLNRDLWVTNLQLLAPPSKKKNVKVVVGVIFRVWNLNEEGDSLIDELLAFTEKNDQYSYVYISLYQKNDYPLIEKLKGKQLLVWDPEKYRLDSFLQDIKDQCDVILSTRAHGVLLNSMIHIPCIAVEIEPKLKAFQQMMPSSIQLLTEKNLHLLDDLIQNAVRQIPDMINCVDKDLKQILPQVNDGINELLTWIGENRKN